jgi:predicted transcriptional regulator
MQQRKTIGERELALLSHVDERGGATVADVVSDFGEPLGLARSTVLTMMERLREKGFLGRRRVHGVFRYNTTSGPVEVMRGAVDNFVRTQLQGSVSPFVAWMSERGEVSRDELAELEALVDKLRTKTGGDA